MGFDVTAAHVIFFIAVLTGASAALGAFWEDSGYVEEARRVEDDRADERAHTNMTVTSATYSAAPQRFTVQVKNMGSTVIDISELVYLVDGNYVASATVEAVDVVGVGQATDVWLPMETLEVDLRPITTTPTYFKLVTSNGASVNWRS